jgi:hypothetical protein
MITSVSSERRLKIWLPLIFFIMAGEPSVWREERLGDAGEFNVFPAFSSLVRRFFSDTGDDAARAALLPDARFAERLILSDKDERPASPFPFAMPEQLQVGKIVFEDFSWNDQHRKIYRKFLVPVLDRAFSAAAFAIENAGASGDRGALPALMLELERQYELLRASIREVVA